MQTVPDAILKWIGGRDDDSIGVEQHNDRAMGLIMTGNKPISGAFSKNKDLDESGEGADRKDKSDKGKKTATKDKELSSGSTTSPEKNEDL